MEDKALSELIELKKFLSRLIGTSDLPPSKQYSAEALVKASKDFRKLEKQRGEWIQEYSFSKYFKNCPYGTGKFIRDEFKFAHYFREGNTYWYNRKTIQALAADLKEKNIKLARYMDYKEEQEKFNKKVASGALNKKNGKNRRGYYIAPNLRDINTSEIPKPPIELVEEDIKSLRKQFLKEKLDDYVDIYDGSFAMLKFEYSTKKYFSAEVKKRSAKWVEDFNYANKALHQLNGDIEPFIPIRDEDMIQL